MGDEMYTETAVQIDAAVSARKYSSDIVDDLARLGRDVEDLLQVWTGGAADSYGQSWAELKSAIEVIAGDLEQIGDLVGESARDYERAESDNATTFSSTKMLRL